MFASPGLIQKVRESFRDYDTTASEGKNRVAEEDLTDLQIWMTGLGEVWEETLGEGRKCEVRQQHVQLHIMGFGDYWGKEISEKKTQMVGFVRDR